MSHAPRRSSEPHGTWSLDRRRFLKTSLAAAAGLVAASRARVAYAVGTHLVVDVSNVPVPDFTRTNRHAGVDVLMQALACAGTYLYRADAVHPWAHATNGLIAKDDVVLVKVNGQWQYRGVTNSDVVRGLIQCVLDHPDGFTGEVVIVENGQLQGSLNCDKGWPGQYDVENPLHEPRANAEDQSHSFQYLIDTVFAEPRVSGYLLDRIRNTWISAGEHVQDGYRPLGYVSYPCFTTARGTRVELQQGTWDGTAHQANVKLLNVPVLKHHGGCGITGALKHVYGLLTMFNAPGAYHYDRIGDATGEMHAVVLPPTLNVVDCIWISPNDLDGGPDSNPVRTNRLLAGFDPVALDYYAAKHVMLPADTGPLRGQHDPDASPQLVAFLTEARDAINLNGGIRGEDVTMDESLFRVVTADAAASVAADGLRVTKSAGETRLDWSTGDPPYRVWRSETPDFGNPVLLADCLQERWFVDAGTLGDGRLYYYLVE